jgi:hypothetical protein
VNEIHVDNIAKRSGFHIYRKKYKKYFVGRIEVSEKVKTCRDPSLGLDLTILSTT